MTLLFMLASKGSNMNKQTYTGSKMLDAVLLVAVFAGLGVLLAWSF
jgi:hypothetical protein